MMRKSTIFLMCILISIGINAQKKELTPEQKRSQKYEKAVVYLQNAHTLDSLRNEQPHHKYLIIYDGYELEEPISTIDPDKVHEIIIKRPNACTSKGVAFDYVVIITTRSTYLRRLNRERAADKSF
jgi:hypothetical protein